ncbi:MAG: hypothetical protein QOJ17_5243 [Rhodospirillaceae bacterium]|jgi:hypothetical protein|nr:hypothetical protein [Rhodospirillaceae bacterium]
MVEETDLVQAAMDQTGLRAMSMILVHRSRTGGRRAEGPIHAGRFTLEKRKSLAECRSLKLQRHLDSRWPSCNPCCAQGAGEILLATGQDARQCAEGQRLRPYPQRNPS